MKSRFKRILFQLHLLTGLGTGIVVFIVATTGCIFVFEEELRGFFYEDILYVKETSSKRFPPSDLIRTAEAFHPGKELKNLHFDGDPQRTVQVNFKDRFSVYVDPYANKVTGGQSQETEFFEVIEKIHRTLYLGDAGKIVTGTSALLFFFMLVSGIILWWPGNKRMRKQKFTLKLKAHPHKRTYDLHSVLGFYASWILLFSALSGGIFAFKWVEGAMYWVTGSEKQEVRVASKPVPDVQIPMPPGAVRPEKPPVIDAAYANVNGAYPGWQELFINCPGDETGVYRFIVNLPNTGFRKNYFLYFDQYSGQLLHEQRYETLSTGEKLRITNYDIHTGRVLGFPGKLLLFFASLIAASLPVTGFLMWKRKRKASGF